MPKKYIYGCISSVKIGFNDLYAIMNTKVYQNALDTIAKVNEYGKASLSESDIYIDVVTASYRIRKRLNIILEEATPEEDIIIFSDISELGFTPKEIKSNFRSIFERGIDMLILDSSCESGLSTYSTVDFEFNRIVEFTEDELHRLCEMINDVTINTRQGRKKTVHPLPDNFDKVYWAFENFFIDEKTTLSNQYFTISKRRFYEFCEQYEKTSDYSNHEKQQNNMFGIGIKPKRYGVVPEYYANLLELVNSGVEIADACNQLEVPAMSEITFHRFFIKYNDGKPNKKLLSQASREYKYYGYDDVYFVPPEMKGEPPKNNSRYKHF